MASDKYPPRKKKPLKGARQQPSEPERTDARPLPDGTVSAPAEQQPAADGTPSREDTINTWTNPVTNQDEQEKITNAGGSDLPVADN